MKTLPSMILVVCLLTALAGCIGPGDNGGAQPPPNDQGTAIEGHGSEERSDAWTPLGDGSIHAYAPTRVLHTNQGLYMTYENTFRTNGSIAAIEVAIEWDALTPLARTLEVSVFNADQHTEVVQGPSPLDVVISQGNAHPGTWVVSPKPVGPVGAAVEFDLSWTAAGQIAR